MVWVKSEGIYHPQNNPNKSIPYVRWTHKVKLDEIVASSFSPDLLNWKSVNEYFVAVSKWRETYSIEVLYYNAGNLLTTYSLRKKISPEDFDTNKHKYLRQAFLKAKLIARNEFENDLCEKYECNRDWDWADDEAYQ